MTSLRFAVLSTAFFGVVSAYGAGATCFLQAVGTSTAGSATGALNKNSVNTGQDLTNMTQAYANKAVYTDTAVKSTLDMTGTNGYGSQCLSGTFTFTGNAFAKHDTLDATNKDFGCNLKFQDLIEFYNPAIAFGQAVHFSITTSLTGITGSGFTSTEASLKGVVTLDGQAPLNVSYTPTVGGSLVATQTYAINNGDILGLTGCLTEAVNANGANTGSKSLAGCMGVTITSTDGGKIKSSCGHYDVPEPTSLLVLVTGLGMIRRRRS